MTFLLFWTLKKGGKHSGEGGKGLECRVGRKSGLMIPE